MTTRNAPRYPDCHVQLTGEDSNAIAIIGRVALTLGRHLRAEGLKQAAIDPILTEFRREAMSSDYNHLLTTCDQWVTVY